MTPVTDRFFERVDKAGPISLRRGAKGNCWIWTGAGDGHGYGRFWDGSKQVIAHRWAYQHHYGAIPSGLVLDHLCRRTACVRPDHLEAVTQAENVRRGLAGLFNARKTHCRAGHAYDEANTRRRNGRRDCRACARIAAARYRAQKETQAA
ncbi:HNH endonuclease signature motif containing protein [Streptomyces sp. NPDC086669]|uniref:HNH endonuclease signature motif containing protein n=1 Tax=Streptomyces sp. NPDC086669 TaxID=3365753 RepID=UPI00382F4151